MKSTHAACNPCDYDDQVGHIKRSSDGTGSTIVHQVVLKTSPTNMEPTHSVNKGASRSEIHRPIHG